VLQLFEPFFTMTSAARTTSQLHDVLAAFADQFEFRSGVLVEFTGNAHREVLILDTHPARSMRWREAGLLPDRFVKKIWRRLHIEQLVTLGRSDWFEENEQARETVEELVLVEMTLVPIELGKGLGGCLGFSGAPSLSSREAVALKAISINLTVQSRFVRSLH
jgi:hypothetical protein